MAEIGKSSRMGRLRGLRRRKRARQEFKCEVLALKMRLVQINKENRH
jgi:hypothetical protein